MAENFRLQRLLADAGLPVEEAAADAAADHQDEVTAHQAEAIRQRELLATLHTSESRLRLILARTDELAF